MDEFPRRPFDLDSYIRDVTSGRRCFICQLVDEDQPSHAIVYRDDQHIAFLNRFPSLLGYTLVAPVGHVEDAVNDVGLDAYLATQTLIHRLGRAISTVIPTERRMC